MRSEDGSTMRDFIVCTVSNKVNEPSRLRWVGHVARLEKSRSPFEILTGTPIGKIP